MQKLSRGALWSLEDYAEQRNTFRQEVLKHKIDRRVSLGPHVTLIFEDFLTMKYQVQEMLRAERIFERAAIDEEIDAYNPLVPDGTNWKATMMLEFPNVDERREHLARLVGVEHRVWTQVGGGRRIGAIANEDLERSNADKTAAVHFLRFELDERARDSVSAGASIVFGVDHPELPHRAELTDAQRASLATDLRVDDQG